MMGYSHALVGTTTVVAVNTIMPFIQPHIVSGVPTGMALCLGAAILGALAPDIDSARQTSLKREAGTAGYGLALFLQMLGVTHRGLTHYGIVVLFIAAVGYRIGAALGGTDVGLAFGLGYMSHVFIADALTKQGIPLWGPWTGRFHLLPGPFRFQTGGLVEQVVFVIIVIVFLALLPQGTPPETVKFLQGFLGN